MTTTERDDWEQAEELTKKHASGKFGKLEDGASCVGAFTGAPYAIETHWVGAASVRCTGDGCPMCRKGVPTKVRVRMNFFDFAQNAMKIWEGGPPFLRDLKVLKKKYGLADMAFEITRQGTGKNTKYIMLPDKPLSAEQKAKIAAMQLHNLAEQDDDEDQDDDEGTSSASNGPSAPPNASASTATIAAPIRNEFISRLQALKSEDALYAFLGEFHVERIGDVLASDEARARRLLESLERKKPEIDPFS